MTSQLPPAEKKPGAPPALNVNCIAALPLFQEPQPGSSQTGVTRESLGGPAEDVTISAEHQEKEGDSYRLRGNVQINFRGYQLNADEVTLNRATGEATATGNVRLEGGPHDEHIRADSAQYNLKDDTGTLRQVTATLGVAVRQGRMVLTSPNPLAFRGERVDRASAERFIVHNGMVTTCELTSPAWSFNAQRVIIDVGSTAQLYHSNFRLKNVPVFYLPYVARPVETLGRQTGFMLPSIGQSSSKGTIVSEGFYWAIDRSSDATVSAEYFSKRGWAQRGEFRARPSERANVDVRYFGVFDRGILVNGVKQDQGGEEVNATADAPLPWGFRGVADIDYLSTYVFRLAFAETYTQAVNSEVKSTAFASRDFGGVFVNLSGSRYQNFESANRGDLVTILHTPSFESSAYERQIANTRLFWGYEASAEGVSRREPGFLTSELVGRFDLQPSLALAVSHWGWSARPEFALRDTYYSERVQPNGALGVPLDDPLNRYAADFSFELRPPALQRIFEKPIFGRKLKHTLEPHVVYRLVSGISNFRNVIHFDALDLFSNTNEVEYGFTTRLFAKRLNAPRRCSSPAAQENVGDQSSIYLPEQKSDAQPACDAPGSVRQVLTWQVAQKAFLDPSFGGAVVNGRRNVLTTTADFTGIAFLTEPRNLSPVISRFRFSPSDSADLQWNLDYDIKKGRISGSTVFATWRFGDIFVGGSHAFFHAPGEIFTTNPVPGPDRFNQFRTLAGYGHPNKRGVSFAGSIGYDSNFSKVQYGTAQLSYNWSCIGISAEYRRFALGAVRPNENQIRFSLSLANIGTFGNLRRQERLY